MIDGRKGNHMCRFLNDFPNVLFLSAHVQLQTSTEQIYYEGQQEASQR